MKLLLGAIFSVLILKANADQATAEWMNYVSVLSQLGALYEEDADVVDSRLTRAVGTKYFEVNFTSTPEEITVHSLRPENIDVVAALGDSITAGTGIDADTIAGVAIQWRGLSWTVGGDEEVSSSLTIPNILQKFNPHVKGYSVGTKTDFDILEQDWFNVAVPGGRAKDMTEQTELLIQRMKADNRTSFNNDWKLISIFIGGNDLCALGRDPDGASPETYRDEVQAALDLMHQEIPRALVQIVQIMEIYLLPDVSSGFGAPPTCRIAQSAVCGHVVDSVEDPDMLAELRQQNWKYQKLIEELIGSGKYDTRNDFTVVIQPFFKDTSLPLTPDGQVDATFFAPDCFHFSSRGHAMGALNVWNNMLEPEGIKSTKWEIKDLGCPTEEHPYIFTRLNSGGSAAKHHNLKKREANAVPKKPKEPEVDEVAGDSCPKVTCKTTPDWAIGVLCALAAVMALQLFLILFITRKSYSHSGDSGSYQSYSL